MHFKNISFRKFAPFSSLTIAGFVMLFFGLGLAVVTLQQPQDNRSRADWTGGQCNLQGQSSQNCCSNVNHIVSRTGWTDVAGPGVCHDVRQYSCPEGRYVPSNIWLCPGDDNIRCCVPIVPPAPPESTPITPPAVPSGMTAFIPFLSNGYKYKVVNHNDLSGFEQPNYDDSAFSTGNAGFGTITKTSCPINHPDTAKTNWPINTDMLLRKTFSLPQGTSNVKLSLAIDDGVKAYVNGHEITLGTRNSFGTGCANYDNYVVDIPQSFLNIGGNNLIAVRGIDTGVVGFVDLRVYGKVDPVIPQTKASFNLLFHGIGKGGDNRNPNGGGNPTPVHNQRTITVEVYNPTDGSKVLTKDGPVNFNATAGNFTGEIDLGTTLTTRTYTIKVIAQSLRGTTTRDVTVGTTNNFPVMALVNGDVNYDGLLDILDYNMIQGCVRDFDLPPTDCDGPRALKTDIDDDGTVGLFDLNLFIRELSVQQL